MKKTSKLVAGSTLALLSCAQDLSTTTDAMSEAFDTATQELSCNLGNTSALGSACTKSQTEVSITAAALANANPPAVIADDNTYGVRFVGAGPFEAALTFTPTLTTTYHFFLGAPNVPFRVVSPSGQVVASCTSGITAAECNKLRRVDTFALTAGQKYRIEFGPTTAAKFMRMYIQTEVPTIAQCDGDDLTAVAAACAAANTSTPVTLAAPGAGSSPAIALDTTYTTTLATVGTNTYAGTFTFTPASTGSYELFLGTPKIPVSVRDGVLPEYAECSRTIPSTECNPLRRGDLFTLVAGTTYTFQLGPNVNTRFVRVALRKSIDADQCALNTDNCDDDPNACVNTDEGFTCQCPANYVGSGVGVDGCTFDGVTSSQSTYILPAAPGVEVKAILSAGDSPNLKPDGVTPYRMVGLPDGAGAFDNGDGTFTWLVNHEISAPTGIARAHGGVGAFVSRWTVRKSDLHVMHGEDLIQRVALWNTATSSYDAPVSGVSFSRFCSGDTPAPAAFFNAGTGLGYDQPLHMNGEESGAEGRAVAHALDGTSWELPRLGKFSWENSLARPFASDSTVVIGTDDSGNGQLYVYVGTKQATGSAVERAGLTNGSLFGVRVPGVLNEDNAVGIPAPTAFDLYEFGNVENTTGAQLQTDSVANLVTGFQRPEDGVWDPANPNDFYFVTTASFTGNSRLWRLSFVDSANPALGGTIEMLLDGSEGQRMLDNMSMDAHGHIMLQEDVGNNAFLGRILRYDVATDALSVVAEFDPNRFVTGAPNFLTQDEESSGIIDASAILGAGWWLLDAQAHYGIAGELVEGGQLNALYDPSTLPPS